MRPKSGPGLGPLLAVRSSRRMQRSAALVSIATAALLTCVFGVAWTRLMTQVEQLDALISAGQRAREAAPRALPVVPDTTTLPEYRAPAREAPAVAQDRAGASARSAQRTAAIDRPSTAIRTLPAGGSAKAEPVLQGITIAPRGESNAAAEPDANADAESIAIARDALRAHPEVLLSLMESQPAMRNGEILGYRIMPVADPELMTLVGLRPGDILASVNGIAFDEPDRALEQLCRLSGIDMLTFLLWRQGQLEVVEYITDQ